MKALQKPMIRNKIVEPMQRKSFTNHPLGDKVLKNNLVRSEHSLAIKNRCKFVNRNNWKRKERTKKTSNSRVLETIFIFPLPLTGTPFLLAIDTKEEH